MKLEKSKNAKRNIVFGLINKIITMILPFIIRSVIIYNMSADYLGLNSLFSSILQVLNLTELGFSNAVVFSMYKPIAENDHKSIKALLCFYRKIYRIIGLIVLVVGMILIPFLDVLIKGSYSSDINIYILYLVYLGNTVLSYFLFAYKSSLLNAHQRTDIISNINTVSSGGMYIVQIIVLFLTKNYYVYVMMMPLFTVANNLIVYFVTKKMYPHYYGDGEVSKEQLSGIKKQVAGLMVTKLCNVSRNSFDSIFVSAFLGLTITAVYGNYYYIMNAVIAILTVVSNAMLAGVGNSIVTEEREKNYRDFRKINFVYMWISGWCTVCLLCLYQPFMKLWVKNDELMFPLSTVILFCIYFYSLEMGVVRSVYSDAAGLWWENRYRAIIEAITNLILNLLLVYFFGITGIISATLISILIINFGFGSQIVFKYYFKNGRLREYFSDHAKYFIATSIVSTVTYLICTFVPFTGLSELIIRLLICCIVPNILYILIYCKTKIYAASIQWMLKMFHLQKLLSVLIHDKHTTKI